MAFPDTNYRLPPWPVILISIRENYAMEASTLAPFEIVAGAYSLACGGVQAHRAVFVPKRDWTQFRNKDNLV
jgi:hypothetical protein